MVLTNALQSIMVAITLILQTYYNTNRRNATAIEEGLCITNKITYPNTNSIHKHFLMSLVFAYLSIVSKCKNTLQTSWGIVTFANRQARDHFRGFNGSRCRGMNEDEPPLDIRRQQISSLKWVRTI